MSIRVDEAPEFAGHGPVLETVDAGGVVAASVDVATSAAVATIDAGATTDDRRRFGGVARLYGDAALDVLAHAHVCVVGIGGVGSWAAEALARSGIGRITLVDADHVAESNVNRQVHALDSTLGAAKVEVMRRRIADIAPRCQVLPVDEFVTEANVADLVPAGALVIDAIDAPRAKAALVACAARRRQPIVVCGAAGGRTDPLRLRRADLAQATGDALLASVRARLRREHGFPRSGHGAFGVLALFSDEPLVGRSASNRTAPLACAGYGSIVMVTAAVGLAAASVTIEMIVKEPIALRVSPDVPSFLDSSGTTSLRCR